MYKRGQHPNSLMALGLSRHGRPYQGPRAYCAPNAHPLVRELHRRIMATHMTAELVAKRAGVSSGTIYSWFRGRNDPKLTLFLAVAEAAGWKLGDELCGHTANGTARRAG